jgi:hypothetical protein
MRVYTARYDHAAASYDQPVLIAPDGTPCGPGDIGLWAVLQPGQQGAVFVHTGAMPPVTYTADDTNAPDAMWRALCRALHAYPAYTRVTVEQGDRVHLERPET